MSDIWNAIRENIGKWAFNNKHLNLTNRWTPHEIRQVEREE